MHRLFLMMILFMFSESAHAHMFRQQISRFQSSDGMQRDRYRMDALYERQFVGDGMSSMTLGMTFGRESFYDMQFATEEYQQRHLDQGGLFRDTIVLNYADTYKKLTDRRVMIFHQDDSLTSITSLAVGAGHWVFSETLQLSADVMANISSRPQQEVLDVDLEILRPPPVREAIGYSFAARHLVTPTTILRYTIGQTYSNERPVMHQFGLRLRQFIPVLRAALYADVGRLVNRGRLDLTTTYGEVDAWMIDLGVFQELGRSWRTRLGYRQYREDEITRAERNQYFMGSDMVSVALQHDLKESLGLKTPITIEASYASYRTNPLDDQGTVVRAATAEIGGTARL